MGSDANRLRRIWQTYAGRNAANAENDFFRTFQLLFNETEYLIRRSPNEFKYLYVNVQLTPQEQAEIYTPTVEIKKHGLFPDYAITNTETNKTIYIEVKRQDGWVEGGKRRDGRGNVHERSCKFFTPGLLSALRTAGNLSSDTIPFWTVFIGNITRDPCRVREVKLWYTGIPEHYFMWRNQNNPTPLIEHFLTHIKPLID